MKQQIFEAIKRYDTIIIHRHVRPDPDAYGSQGGLAEIIRAAYPAKKVYIVGKHDPSLGYMGVPNVIKDDVYQNALVIVCDTANKERICDARYSQGDMLIKIDHHPNEDPYGDIMWVDTSVSSTSEMIYEFYEAFRENGLTITDEAARLIFAGIVADTGRFLYPGTTRRTLEYAGALIQYQFDRTELFNHMYELDPQVIKLQGYVLDHFIMNSDGAANVALTKETLQSYGVLPSEASLLVSSLGNIKGIRAWCFFIEEEDQIRVRLRSKGPVINTIAMKYNGGGHPFAAGASVYSWAETENVIKDINEACRP
jgi:phosphoesterase RecJ-like protein